MRVAVLVAVLTAGLASAQTYSISTFAGGAVPLNVPATSVSLIPFLTHVAVDKSRNVYFTEANAVLRLDAVTGLITLVAGNWTDGFSGDNGPATSAQLRKCNGLALDSAGNLYIADTGNNRVRKVSAGIITTVAGNGSPGFGGDNRAAVDAQLSPVGIALDTAGNLYIADPTNQRIRKLTSGVIITVAGSGVAGYGGDNGPASAALLNYPEDVAVDSAGTLYIADYANNRVRSVSAGVICAVAGNGVEGPGGDSGPATSAQLHHPSGVAVDPSTGALFIADPGNARVRRVQNGIISTVAGGGGVAPVPADNGPATNASLNLVYPDIINVALDSAGNLYIPDVRNSRLRKVTSGIITTVAGNGLFGYSGDGAPALSAQM